jgi:imidazolonepropionase-like amidohydrolase
LDEAAMRQQEDGAVAVDGKSHFQRARELVRAMHRAGVQLLAGTDGPSTNGRPRATVQRELELLVESGLTPLEALQAATFNPALYMVKLDKYGVVAPAHLANLVLLEANPLADIRNLRRIEGVVMRGHYFSRPDLNRMLSQALEQIDQKNAATADSE